MRKAGPPAMSLKILKRAEKALEYAEHTEFVTTWGPRIFNLLVSLGLGKVIQYVLQKWVTVPSDLKVAAWLILSGVFFWLGLIIISRLKKKATPTKLEHPALAQGENLDVSLAPSSGPSDKMLLAIKNNGKKQKFHAACKTIARRNDPNRLLQKTYDLPREIHALRHSTIARGESRNLLVATADTDQKNQTEQVQLIERSANGEKKPVEWSRWTKRQHTPPEYDLEVPVFGEGDCGPHTEQFTLKCDGNTAALEMVPMLPHGNSFSSRSSSKIDPDGKLHYEAEFSRTIDCNAPGFSKAALLGRFDWEALASKFKDADGGKISVWAEWIRNLETNDYEWWIRGESEVVIRLLTELCKRGGRALMDLPGFAVRFPQVTQIKDDGDRWLLALLVVADFGKVRGKLESSSLGTTMRSGEAGEIKNLSGASQVMCHIAVNDFE
jgi:hypothetical protein